jgi:hypothetical protein
MEHFVVFDSFATGALLANFVSDLSAAGDCETEFEIRRRRVLPVGLICIGCDDSDTPARVRVDDCKKSWSVDDERILADK